MISSKTSFIALIGNPVSHSLSPIMQNAALQYLGLDLIYIAVPCKDEDLGLVLNSFKKINCKGLNITIPYKEKVFNLCSEISPIANKLKAINTLKLNSEKKWSATNTAVEYVSDFLVGTVVFRFIIFVITPPKVSTPRESLSLIHI